MKSFDVNNFEILSVRGYWEEASRLAENWKGEAYLSHASIDIPLPNANRGVRASIGYQYLTPKNDTLMLTVACSGANCSTSETEHDPEFPLVQRKKIRIDDFELTSEEAFEIGVREGGFRYIYNQNALASLLLGRDLPDYSGDVIWIAKFIQFKTGDFPDELRVEIDANTGEVLEVID